MAEKNEIYDLIGVGAGPANLSLLGSGVLHNWKCMLIEAGKKLEERDAKVPYSVGTGVAGAGAFIDGKFSFFPAGTNLWKTPYHTLEEAYKMLREILKPYMPKESPMPRMPSEKEILEYFFELSQKWQLKKYPSIYMDVEKRFEFLQNLIKDVSLFATILCETMVIDIAQIGFEQNTLFRVVTRNIVTNETATFVARRVVLGGGRFMPLQKLLRSLRVNNAIAGEDKNVQKEIFRRYEFGIRIQVPHDNPGIVKMGSYGVLDPKFIISPESGIEFRTFCFCKRGNVLESRIGQLETFSGTADCEETQFTNFGLMAQSTKQLEIFSEEQVQRFCAKKFEISGGVLHDMYKEFTQEGQNDIAILIWSAFTSFIKEFPELLCKELTIFGPCYEGVGMYPNVVDHFRIQGIENLYAIGDCGGVLRGLVPSMLSGFALAQSLGKLSSICLVSENVEKIFEIRAALGMMPTIIFNSTTITSVCVVSLPCIEESMSNDSKYVARSKALYALKEYKDKKRVAVCQEQESMKYIEYLLVEVTSVEIDELNQLPGVHCKLFFERMSNEKLFRIAQGSKITFTSTLAAINVNTEKIYFSQGFCFGTIVKPQGEKGFGWDSIFQPEGYHMTYGQMKRVVKTKISARFLAARAMREDYGICLKL